MLVTLLLSTTVATVDCQCSVHPCFQNHSPALLWTVYLISRLRRKHPAECLADFLLLDSTTCVGIDKHIGHLLEGPHQLGPSHFQQCLEEWCQASWEGELYREASLLGGFEVWELHSQLLVRLIHIEDTVALADGFFGTRFFGDMTTWVLAAACMPGAC